MCTDTIVYIQIFGYTFKHTFLQKRLTLRPFKVSHSILMTKKKKKPDIPKDRIHVLMDITLNLQVLVSVTLNSSQAIKVENKPER